MRNKIKGNTKARPAAVRKEIKSYEAARRRPSEADDTAPADWAGGY